MRENIVTHGLNITVREDRHGRPHLGIYWIADKMVHNSYLGTFETKSAVIGESSAGGLAVMLLKEAMQAAGAID